MYTLCLHNFLCATTTVTGLTESQPSHANSYHFKFGPRWKHIQGDLPRQKRWCAIMPFLRSLWTGFWTCHGHHGEVSWAQPEGSRAYTASRYTLRWYLRWAVQSGTHTQITRRATIRIMMSLFNRITDGRKSELLWYWNSLSIIHPRKPEKRFCTVERSKK